MKTELTLTIEKELVEEAEKLASAGGLSLSEVVEAHLQKLVGSENRLWIAEKLRGRAAEGPLTNMTYEEIREDYANHQLKR